MVTVARVLDELLPHHLLDLLDRDFIPWSFIKNRHADLAAEPLTALFEAYSLIDGLLDLETAVTRDLPEDSWGCRRCGFCCSFMRPGAVKASTYQVWEKAGAPVARFYRARRKASKNTVYMCWYHNDIRLRICPFMIINRKDHLPFCSIYHMGNDLRPPVCSKFVPRHATCTSRDFELVPWECN